MRVSFHFSRTPNSTKVSELWFPDRQPGGRSWGVTRDTSHDDQAEVAGGLHNEIGRSGLLAPDNQV